MAEPDRLRFQVQPTQSFAFDLALAYLRTSPSSILEDISASAYRRALRINGEAVVVTVEGSATRLDVELTGSRLTPADELAARALVRRVFATDHDVTTLLDDVRDDPVFFNLARRLTGLRPTLIPDLFETTVWAIIGQQINVRFAAKCKRALVDLCGERIHVDGVEYVLFPGPERLATINASDLAAIQFSRQKIRYVVHLAREICDGRLNLDELWDLPAPTAMARLESILGIGRWTAEYVLMRGLGHPDVIPAADGGLRRIIGQSYRFGRSATESEVRQLAQHWAGWRSYAAFYWWFALQQSGRTPDSTQT